MKKKINHQSSKNKKLAQFIYNGRSMMSVFNTGQLLYTQPDLRDISIGDVIIFCDQDRMINVVHRVSKIEGNLVYTRGDNNISDDYTPIQIQDILGIVRWANQDGSMAPVEGGIKGYKHSNKRAAINHILNVVKQVFSPMYQILKNSGIIQKFWHPKITTIRFETENGELIKYIFQNQTVAQWNVNLYHFTCKHPFDLVIKIPQDISK